MGKANFDSFWTHVASHKGKKESARTPLKWQLSLSLAHSIVRPKDDQINEISLTFPSIAHLPCLLILCASKVAQDQDHAYTQSTSQPLHLDCIHTYQARTLATSDPTQSINNSGASKKKKKRNIHNHIKDMSDSEHSPRRVEDTMQGLFGSDDEEEDDDASHHSQSHTHNHDQGSSSRQRGSDSEGSDHDSIDKRRRHRNNQFSDEDEEDEEDAHQEALKHSSGGKVRRRAGRVEDDDDEEDDDQAGTPQASKVDMGDLFGDEGSESEEDTHKSSRRRYLD